jgi:hypothetical protein
LTFMHGSRRRLDDRLRSVPELRGRAAAATIDSFSRSIWQRWRTLATHHSIGDNVGDFDRTCDVCGLLLERPEVASWVARSYPIVMVDEAQELAPPRLRVIRALAAHAALFVAADEFQSLDEDVDTAPFMAWFRTGEITRLDQVYRTKVSGLLSSGIALRQLAAPREGAGLKISYEYPNVMPFKIGAALVGVSGTKAVLYPPGGSQWAQELIERLAKGLYSEKFHIPPLKLTHELRPRDEVEAVKRLFVDRLVFEINDIVERLIGIADRTPWALQVHAAIHTAYCCQGKRSWTADELAVLLERKLANYRAYATEPRGGIPVMSIHQAKNREFQHVVLLWPPGVPGSDELKARLLYNGITRAQSSCKVFVRTKALLAEPPFRFG